MAGVGKTTALIGLGHDPEIRAHFTDGVLFLSLGANATEDSVINDLVKIMDFTGAVSKAFAVEAASSLAEATSFASNWFHGKRILFLIDDIWPTPDCPQGFLYEMNALLQGSPEGRIATSTRSTVIAIKTSLQVDFGARDPQGDIAIEMFMSHAIHKPGIAFDDDHVEAARGMLGHCAGLPIALAVTGEGVAARINALSNVLREACRCDACWSACAGCSHQSYFGFFARVRYSGVQS